MFRMFGLYFKVYGLCLGFKVFWGLGFRVLENLGFRV